MKIEIVVNKEKHLESVVVDGNKVFGAGDSKAYSLEIQAGAYEGAERVYRCRLDTTEEFSP